MESSQGIIFQITVNSKVENIEFHKTTAFWTPKPFHYILEPVETTLSPCVLCNLIPTRRLVFLTAFWRKLCPSAPKSSCHTPCPALGQCHTVPPLPSVILGYQNLKQFVCCLARTFPDFCLRKKIYLQAILLFEVLCCIQRCSLKRFLIDCLKCFRINWACCFLGILLFPTIVLYAYFSVQVKLSL